MRRNIKKTFYYGLIILVCFLFYKSVMGQGTCASPDGAMFSIASPPSGYQELEDNGYCIDGINETKWHYMCWTFTPTKPIISLNAGYNTSCNIAQFDLAASPLYDNSCTIVSVGQDFTITPDQQYTWCLRLKSSGGPGCTGFDRVCPYFTETSLLPVELTYLECDSGWVIWQTASEINNDFFSIYSSQDLSGWIHKTNVEGAGNSNKVITYQYFDSDCKEELYYMLEQTDYDGDRSFEGIVHCDCNEYITPEYTIEEYNILGQIYEGEGVKILKIKKGNKIIYKKIIKL